VHQLELVSASETLLGSNEGGRVCLVTTKDFFDL
jgi:hypothetical protein